MIIIKLVVVSDVEVVFKIIRNEAYMFLLMAFRNMSYILVIINIYWVFFIWFIVIWWESINIIFILKWNKGGFRRLKNMFKFIYLVNICRFGI